MARGLTSRLGHIGALGVRGGHGRIRRARHRGRGACRRAVPDHAVRRRQPAAARGWRRRRRGRGRRARGSWTGTAAHRSAHRRRPGDRGGRHGRAAVGVGTGHPADPARRDRRRAAHRDARTDFTIRPDPVQRVRPSTAPTAATPSWSARAAPRSRRRCGPWSLALAVAAPIVIVVSAGGHLPAGARAR